MSDITKTHGTVLSAMPIGENDKRLVLQTCELGKITVFVPGCRRAGNALAAAANPFATGTFCVTSGRSAYRITEASIKEYFRALALRQPGVYMGFYFLEMVDFYGREGIDGTDMLNLLYISLKALQNDSIRDKLIRRIFEMRLISINGDFAPDADKMSAQIYALCRLICDSPLERLYSFDLDGPLFDELSKICDRALNRIVDRKLKSREIMEEMYALL